MSVRRWQLRGKGLDGKIANTADTGNPKPSPRQSPGGANGLYRQLGEVLDQGSDVVRYAGYDAIAKGERASAERLQEKIRRNDRADREVMMAEADYYRRGGKKRVRPAPSQGYPLLRLGPYQGTSSWGYPHPQDTYNSVFASVADHHLPQGNFRGVAAEAERAHMEQEFRKSDMMEQGKMPNVRKLVEDYYRQGVTKTPQMKTAVDYLRNSRDPDDRAIIEALERENRR